MRTLERARLLSILSPHREVIAAAWERAIARTGYVPLSSAQVHERLLEWVDQLTGLLCADVLDAEAAHGVGAGIARLYYAHPATISETLKVLGQGLIDGVPDKYLRTVHAPLSTLMAELAAGFLSDTRQIILTEQETIRNALLSAKQQTQEALRESEARFRALFEAAAIGIGVGDMQGRILETNRALQALLGYSADEMRNRSVAEFMHPDDLQNVWDMYQQLVSGQIDYFELEKPFYRKGGQSVWTHLTVSLVRDADGNPQLQIAMIENVTERKQAEETVKRLNVDLERRVLERTAQLSALNQVLADEIAMRSAVEAERLQLLARAQAARADAEAAQQQLAFLAEASSVLASSLDYKTTLASVARLAVPYLADWCAVDVRDGAGALHRLAVAHVDLAKVEVVRGLEGHYPARSDRLSGVASVLESGQPEFSTDLADVLLETAVTDDRLQRILLELQPRARITVPVRTREGTIGAITFVLAESGRRYTRDDLVLAEDLARRAALAIESARLYQEAQLALAMRDEFLSVAAHELKTPITSLRGFAQLTVRALDQEGNLDHRRLRQALAVVDSQSDKLTRLVSQLLDVSRIQSGRLTLNSREADLSQVVADAVATTQQRSETHHVVVHAPLTLPMCIDALRIEQVLTNLLDNAIKFSPRGGTIDVDVELARPEPGLVQLSVRDRGIGIAPEHRGKIFGRFFQAEAAESHTAGMGLGLYISRQIVELHGGRISAEFPDDGGTRFVVALPNNPTGASTCG